MIKRKQRSRNNVQPLVPTTMYILVMSSLLSPWCWTATTPNTRFQLYYESLVLTADAVEQVLLVEGSDSVYSEPDFRFNMSMSGNIGTWWSDEFSKIYAPTT